MTMFNKLNEILGDRRIAPVGKTLKLRKMSPEMIAVVYQFTDIVVLNVDGSASLCSDIDGKLTSAVKKHISEYANCKIRSINGVHYVDYDGKTVKFVDGVTIRVPKNKQSGCLVNICCQKQTACFYVHNVQTIAIIEQMVFPLSQRFDRLTANQLVDLLTDEGNSPDQVDLLKSYIDERNPEVLYVHQYMTYH